jgi:hypothetical protein
MPRVAVSAGMLGVTLFGLLLTLVFHVAIRKLVLRFESRPDDLAAPAMEKAHVWGSSVGR